MFHRIVNYDPDFMKAVPKPNRASDAKTQGIEEIPKPKENHSNGA